MPLISSQKERVLSLLQTSALQAASPIVLALEACEDELREEAVTLFKQLASGELTPDEEFATVTLLTEILFPGSDLGQFPNIELQETEELAQQHASDADSILKEMDREEESFANNLRRLMDEKNITQIELAERLGIGQPAISMMLQRQCRPQRRTVARIAAALGVEPAALWSGF